MSTKAHLGLASLCSDASAPCTLAAPQSYRVERARRSPLRCFALFFFYFFSIYFF
jgi:hypothetical protein